MSTLVGKLWTPQDKHCTTGSCLVYLAWVEEAGVLQVHREEEEEGGELHQDQEEGVEVGEHRQVPEEEEEGAQPHPQEEPDLHSARSQDDCATNGEKKANHVSYNIKMS